MAERSPAMPAHVRDHLVAGAAIAITGGAPGSHEVPAAYGLSHCQRGLEAVLLVEEYAAVQESLFAQNPPDVHQIIARFIASALAASIAACTARKHQNDLLMEAPVAIAVVEGPQHRFTLANSAYRALVSDRDVVGKPLAEALEGLAISDFAVLLDRVRASGQPLVGNGTPIAVPLHGEDTAMFLDFVYTPMRATDGVMVTGWDVTELVASRQRVEMLAADVRARETELRLVMDELPFLISFVDADERYGVVNKAYEDWFGIPAEQLIGRKVIDVIGPAAYEVLGPYVRRGLAGERFSFDQLAVPYRLGGTRDVRVTFVPRIVRGRVDGYVATLEDITKIRELEVERERLSRQRTEILDSMGDGFFAVDAAWRVTQLNRNFEQVSGIDRANVIGRVLWDVVPQVPAYVESYQRCMTERAEVRFVDSYGSTDVWHDVRAFPTSDGGISVFIRDISAESRARIALSERADFEQQLIGIVSHDLRSPLNVISLATNFLLESGELSPMATKNIVRIESAGDRALRLVRDLLDFTRSRFGGGIPIDPQPMDLHSVVNDVVEEVRSTFPNRSIDVVHDGAGHGVWDRDRLAQVVQNLATNALKYSPSDGTVRISSNSDADEIVLVVHNGGATIPAAALATLFEPYERAAAKLDSASRSVGLGLYIVRTLVHAHGGNVEARSAEDEGTTFIVRLPRRTIQQPALALL
ncbi:MAG TPA: PAS domain-containing protein [Kofleriaceae bacterium]